MKLKRDKRYQIKFLLNVGLLQKVIAKQVGMTPISRQVKQIYLAT